MDPRSCTIEEFAFLENQNNELKQKLAVKSAGFDEIVKAYHLLESMLTTIFAYYLASI